MLFWFSESDRVFLSSYIPSPPPLPLSLSYGHTMCAFTSWNCSKFSLHLPMPLSELDNSTQKKNLNATFSNFGANCDKTSRTEPPTDLKSANLSKQKQPYPSACSLPTPIWDIVAQWLATRFSTCTEGASWRRSRCPLHPSVWEGSVDLGRSDFSQVGHPAVCSDGLFQAAQGPCWCTLDFRRGFGGKWAELLRKLVSFRFVAFFQISRLFWQVLSRRSRRRSDTRFRFIVFENVFCWSVAIFFDVLGIGCLLVEGWPDSVL